MIELFQVNLTKADLSAMPANERQLLLLLGHAANEINVFQKLLLMSEPQDLSKGACINKASVEQYFILLRVLIGKLHEAWNLFSKRFVKDREIKNKYEEHLNNKVKAALSDLKNHFGNSLLTKIRNNVSFHYLDKDNLIEKSFESTPEKEEWEFLISETQANTFYYASELVIDNAIINLVDLKNANGDEPYNKRVRDALDELMRITLKMANDISVLFNQCICDIIASNCPNIQRQNVSIKNTPQLSKIRIPFFIEIDTAPDGCEWSKDHVLAE